MKIAEIIEYLESESDSENLAGMARFGITPDKAFGIKLPVLRKLAKTIGRDHALANALWKTGYRETQILASLIEEPDKVTEKQIDRWAKDFFYWEICDQCCINLFHQLPFAYNRAIAWTRREGEQQKRAGYALMAVVAWKDKKVDDQVLIGFFPHIMEGAMDPRGPVKKAVSWALRSIGKRNIKMNEQAIALARKMEKLDSKSAKWVAKDVLKELTDPVRQNKIRNKK
jgi:3-methyladenine DNA glycosylase AlkD